MWGPVHMAGSRGSHLTLGTQVGQPGGHKDLRFKVAMGHQAQETAEGTWA